MFPTRSFVGHILQRQFIDLGRSNCKKSKRYRCRHCQKEFAATSVGRPKEHLATCDKWQAKQRQERQARDNASYLPSYSEAVQEKITEVGVQHISQDQSGASITINHYEGDNEMKWLLIKQDHNDNDH
ncbi:uncharacterized protein FPOAC1_013397 [Fusarium poae]|uniref:uncharacterized protein n=1 Tax=Fusarium poae TaxID=36050 RepID=UPI001D04FD07|nr:uncharacterized protein FPOAC1_014074 [Fusarium poae]XP_044701120.1 uncharacterized protein FPOAC1_013397 [Fusarium poae]KAG8664105.1 hypothetical protein FPOAC1_014074 [Fusarium poae]KAG8664617.1 hypothetical protein FPOAC1_013397 [Fusarium poae]